MDEGDVNVLEDDRFLPSPSFLPMDIMNSDLFGDVEGDQKLDCNSVNRTNLKSSSDIHLQGDIQNHPTVTPTYDDGLLPLFNDYCPENTSRESCDDSQWSVSKSSPLSEPVNSAPTGDVWVTPRPVLHGQHDDLMLSDWIQQYVSYQDINIASENDINGQAICFPGELFPL